MKLEDMSLNQLVTLARRQEAELVESRATIQRMTAAAYDDAEKVDRLEEARASLPAAGAVLTDEQLTELMRPELFKADGGFVCDTFPDEVIAAGRAILAAQPAAAAPDAQAEDGQRLHEKHEKAKADLRDLVQFVRDVRDAIEYSPAIQLDEFPTAQQRAAVLNIVRAVPGILRQSSRETEAAYEAGKRAAAQPEAKAAPAHETIVAEAGTLVCTACGTAAPAMGEELPPQDTLRNQMAYIAAYDPDELDGRSSADGLKAVNRLRSIINRARACMALRQQGADLLAKMVAAPVAASSKAEDGSVPVPTNANMAKMMVLLGSNWLVANAPDQIATAPVSQPAAHEVTVHVPRGGRAFHVPAEVAAEIERLRLLDAKRPTDISGRLRSLAADGDYPHRSTCNVSKSILRTAADECDHYYGGMMAWKQTAEKKDADWRAESMARVDERIAARQAAAQGESLNLIVRDVAELDYSSDLLPDLMAVTEADLRAIIARHIVPQPLSAPAGSDAQRNAMMSAYALCPTEMSHPDRMKWMANFFMERMGLAPAGSEQEKPFHHYGLSSEEVAQLLNGGLKPEEIAGPDDTQHDRVGELVRWFARFTQGHASPKWATRHACELAYFIATNGINRGIDLKAVRDAAFKEGVNITPEERGTLDIAYRNGVSAGWNAGVDGDEDALARLKNRVGTKAEYAALFPAVAAPAPATLKRYFVSESVDDIYEHAEGNLVKFADVQAILAAAGNSQGLDGGSHG